MKRRFFLFAAPAIVAAPSLMRVSAAVLDSLTPNVVGGIDRYGAAWYAAENIHGGTPNLAELVTETIRNRSYTIAESMRRSNAILQRLSERGHPLLVTNS